MERRLRATIIRDFFFRLEYRQREEDSYPSDTRGVIMSITFLLNGKSTALDADPNMPLLWAIREVAGLHGTKFGCGMAMCGACTIHLDGQAVRSCVMPLSAVSGRHVTTIE